jgi:hypothetical protein
MQQEGKYLTRAEAAAVCGVHVDTLRRDERAGRLPATRQRDGGIEYLVTDLVAAGRLDPVAAAADVNGTAHRAIVEQDLVEARRQLAVLNERLDAKRERVAALEAEVAYLRRMLDKAVA